MVRAAKVSFSWNVHKSNSVGNKSKPIVVEIGNKKYVTPQGQMNYTCTIVVVEHMSRTLLRISTWLLVAGKM